MKGFIKRFFNALKPCAGVVHAPAFKVAMPPHSVEERGHSTASGRLVSRGSIAMARFPMVSEDEMAVRKEKILHYDFNSFK